ncbi:conserved hypothetical protein [Histoplasma capsulatum var. duboisii H88]|uniref:Uncharacterized protein n=2 Tax=Ajellomyces capsulatus TaxID=5037 RepID=F0UE24_AJEC8|nr:conserved hypothetical protein [Histoplasma capsulatum H143]EGC44554.1 conserved hypothetical protein [Histoplasma capsulatum var. duboisii H88]QSS55329.1 hypothetical protein I7I53_03186 [Histoplasma capsulatum var. duboisii H88]
MHHIARKPVSSPTLTTTASISAISPISPIVPAGNSEMDPPLYQQQYSSEPSSILPHAPPLEELFPTLELPTNGPEISSGFPYNQRLFQLHVSPDEWTRFSDELAYAVRLTVLEKCAVWSVGVGVGLVATGALAVFGPIPAYYAGKGIKNSRVAKKVRRSQKGKGELEVTLSNWNENVFRSKGFRVWLRLPRRQQEKLDSKMEKSERKKMNNEEYDDIDVNDSTSSLSSKHNPHADRSPLGPQSDSKLGLKVEPRESMAARKKREKLEAKRLETHYTLMVEDIRKPIDEEELLQFGVIEIEEPESNRSLASSPVSSRGDPPEYDSPTDSRGSLVELEETCLPPGAVLPSRGIYELAS